MAFTSERRYFANLKANLSAEVKVEFESAMSALLNQYNTTIRENRFIAGGATEVFTVALLRSTGIPARMYGEETDAGDIILPGNKMLSVKGEFAKSSSVRLLNKLGQGKRNLKTATIFVLSGTGMIYADPDMFDESDFRDTGDALVILRRSLLRVADNPGYFIEMEIPFKPPKEQSLHSRNASQEIAKRILYELELENLYNSMDRI
ncbi:MAG: hypothetical protein OXG25_08700 [Gammaproteobacteria bacterium]|nr:hypothetical protein [Gammaproteobacteria bacterium]